jgi:2'-5' RNA ligase
MMRLFIAIELPAHVRDGLAAWQNALRRSIRQKVSWTATDNLHVTLKFIGETEESKVQSIVTALAQVPVNGAIPVSIEGLIRLPSRGRTRVIGARMVDPTGNLSALHSQIETALESQAIAREGRAYRPHVTLGRVRSPASVRIENVKLPEREFRFDVHEFLLMRSTLSPGGSKYDVIERFRLKRESRR